MNVETSPLEDLLIEHPSMSVYRATASPVAPETPPPTPDAPDERNVEENVVLRDVVPGANMAMATPVLPERNNPRRRQIAEQEDRRPSIHDGRPPADRSRRTEQRIAQLRSAQKVMYVVGHVLFFFFFFLLSLRLSELLGVSNCY